jgi:hypothetical protein
MGDKLFFINIDRIPGTLKHHQTHTFYYLKEEKISGTENIENILKAFLHHYKMQPSIASRLN